MRKYAHFSEIEERLPYRIDIFDGKYKGYYMFESNYEVRKFLLQIGVDISIGTKIFFSEKSGSFDKYVITDYIEIGADL